MTNTHGVQQVSLTGQDRKLLEGLRQLQLEHDERIVMIITAQMASERASSRLLEQQLETCRNVASLERASERLADGVTRLERIMLKGFGMSDPDQDPDQAED